ncbi:glyoxalase [Leifsonia poae]|uniref:glyoxalase n=1 Tax=Leifsonia poae TaxID=110933 RepID=UPI001CC1809E|nr:glyoxalase [Leifsonia poae]
MTSIESVTIETADPVAAEQFYAAAFGLGARVRVRASDAPTSGFRAFTLSLIVSQPGNVSALLDAALAAGATAVKPLERTLWGVGGVVAAPDGTLWKVATSTKKDTTEPSRTVDKVVLLLGSGDVAASKRFYLNRGFTVGKSFGKYVEFATPSSPIGLGLYARRALAKDAGVPPEGAGSHRITVAGSAGPFTDPDGFEWAAPKA